MTAKAAATKRRRSGSERRQRTDTVSLRLLPSEAMVLRAIAEQQGHPSVQALIVDLLKPVLANDGAAGRRLAASATARAGSGAAIVQYPTM
jgi:hypothetical protein